MSLAISSLGTARRKGLRALSPAIVDTLVIAAFAAVVSLLRTGFAFGIWNNLFHLPIVGGLGNEPQFHDDAFIQSLRYFASGVWILLNDTQKDVGQTEVLFFVLNYLSRLLSFVGFLCCASLLGVVTRRDKIVFSLILCAIAFLDGYARAGMGGLFVNYFTHSEIANGTVLLAIYFAARGWFTSAAIACGVTFFVNAFVAVWLAPLLVLVAVTSMLRGETTLRTVWWRTLAGLVISLPIAYPVLHAVLGNPEFGKPPGFDYPAYLREYYAGHSLITAVDLDSILVMVAVIAAGAAAFAWFGARARALRAAYLGAVLVYAVGIVIPFVSGANLVLNLQLLRSGTQIYLLAGLAMAALATNWLSRDRAIAFLPGCLMVLCLGINGIAIALVVPLVVGVILATGVTDDAPASHRRFGYATLALAGLVLWPLAVWQNVAVNRLFNDAVDEWQDVGNWARAATRTDAIFLPLPRRAETTTAHPGDLALARVTIFEFVAHRRIWVDQKRGAAAMWTPSYYPIWHERMTETEALESHAARLAYAAGHGIDYVVDRCETLSSQRDVVFRTGRLCISAAERAPAS
ncbi:hypothetical protein [Bradyrhizobium cytisi]|uniref:Glycosyltransferase RgtA/B/C/D-like domain-containing protein n=1 Tax=Bradyrhizobium cytisi TaxID=515489 RepID=A0A5S4XFA0_9BRAD|nr:hypothetical protein [Bradyrhizobium cytisi]TYL88201.1 hypothetical protein FXB38_01620 [Bradyrhizobium cytisi]